MLFLYPTFPMSKDIDEEYKLEQEFIMQNPQLKHKTATIDIESKKMKKIIDMEGEKVIWRGWMLNKKEYSFIQETVLNNNGVLMTSYEEYIGFHHIDKWYSNISEYTFNTHIFYKKVHLLKAKKKLLKSLIVLNIIEVQKILLLY